MAESSRMNRSFLFSLIGLLLTGWTPLVFSADAQGEDFDLFLKMLPQIKAHYVRPLTPEEMQSRSFKGLLSKLDPDTHLEAVGPSSSDFVRGLQEEGSISKVYRPREGGGYLHIAFWGRRTAPDFDEAAEQLKKEGVRHLILDLRGNEGGDLESGVAFLERFIPPGQLLFTLRNRDPFEVKRYSRGMAQRISMGLIVLTDQKTASTSEIVVDALQRYAHADLVGEPTRGKRSVQEAFPVDASHVLFLTTGYFYLPSESKSGKIEPDFSVSSDRALERALVLVENSKRRAGRGERE